MGDARSGAVVELAEAYRQQVQHDLRLALGPAFLLALAELLPGNVALLFVLERSHVFTRPAGGLAQRMQDQITIQR